MINCIVFSDFTNGAGRSGDGALLTNAILAAHAAAIQEQLCGPYAAAWDGAVTRCRVGLPMGADCGSDEWLMGYWQSPDIAGAAGYHAVDPSGRPYGKVFLDDAENMSKDSRGASGIASHEALEMRGDPWANIFASRPDGTLDAYEMADAVEDTGYAACNGVWVSNFLLPSAFDPGAVGPYDQLGVLKSAYDTTPGGYRITGTIRMGKLAFQAEGPGLLDASNRTRKLRPHSRVSRRKAVIV